VSPYRGAGMPHGNIVMETMMNRLADRLGLDRVELRRRNLVMPTECPYDGGMIFQYGTALIHRDCDYPALLAKLMSVLDYDGFKASQAGLRARGIHKGIGIERYVVVHDCGVMINPAIVDGQVPGATAQGIGGAFHEKLHFDDAGQLLTTTFVDYLIPTAMEIPHIELHHVSHPSSLNPLGVKSVGESGVMPVAPALAAAVEDALRPFGAKINAVPFGPPDVLAAIERRGDR
jgi:CO/xanthine dehydrogenase Mo-binding subunit